MLLFSFLCSVAMNKIPACGVAVISNPTVCNVCALKSAGCNEITCGVAVFCLTLVRSKFSLYVLLNPYLFMKSMYHCLICNKIRSNTVQLIFNMLLVTNPKPFSFISNLKSNLTSATWIGHSQLRQ